MSSEGNEEKNMSGETKYNSGISFLGDASSGASGVSIDTSIGQQVAFAIFQWVDLSFRDQKKINRNTTRVKSIYFSDQWGS